MVSRQLKLSDRGVQMLCDLEGFKAEKYQDVVGIWTIGYGTVWKPGMPEKVTQEQAKDLLRQAVAKTEAWINHNVDVPLSQNQFDALVLFTYNVGIGAFLSSTLLKKLNHGDYNGAANQFDVWVYAQHNKIDGLVNRRAKEKKLFLEG